MPRPGWDWGFPYSMHVHYMYIFDCVNWEYHDKLCDYLGKVSKNRPKQKPLESEIVLQNKMLLWEVLAITAAESWLNEH